MIIRAYIRIGKDRGSRNPLKIDISLKPDNTPIFKQGYQSRTYLPTTSFALDLHVPDEAFNRAERVAGVVQVREEDLSIGIEPLNRDEDAG